MFSHLDIMAIIIYNIILLFLYRTDIVIRATKIVVARLFYDSEFFYMGKVYIYDMLRANINNCWNFWDFALKLKWFTNKQFLYTFLINNSKIFQVFHEIKSDVKGIYLNSVHYWVWNDSRRRLYIYRVHWKR